MKAIFPWSVKLLMATCIHHALLKIKQLIETSLRNFSCLILTTDRASFFIVDFQEKP
jgi:hypothetical protein